MNMWIRRAVILTLFCSVCPMYLDCPTESDLVSFESRNFNTTLRWRSAEPRENVTYKYSVKYMSYADWAEFQSVARCQNISSLHCDLTEETSVAPNEHYLAQVFVNGRLHGCTKMRFSPLTHTIFGPPILSTKATASALHVHAMLPPGPNGESIGDIIARGSIGRTGVSYTLNITHPEGLTQVKENYSGSSFILNLENKTTYCGYVFYKLKPEKGRPQSEKATFCETLKADDHLNYLPWLLLTAVCLLALVILTFVCMCKYANANKKVGMPSSLIFSKNLTKLLMLQTETISNSELNMYPRNVKNDSLTIHIQKKPSVPSASVGGYSPQDLPWQNWQDFSEDTAALSLASDSEATSARSSVSYSAVAPHEPTKDQDASNDPEISNKLPFPCVEFGSNCRMTSVTAFHTRPPLSVRDCPDSDPGTPLLLHMARESEGNLPFWSSQFQISTADLQRRPLLSDLINSTMEQPSLPKFDDTESSECGDSMITAPTQMGDSHYIQIHSVIPNFHQGSLNSSSTDGGSESCYKQNWIPKINIETVSMSSDGDRRTGYSRSWNGLKNEDSEAEEESEEAERFQLSEHFLGNWLLQIQD